LSWLKESPRMKDRREMASPQARMEIGEGATSL